MNTHDFMIDAKGRSVPINMVTDADKLKDQTIAKIVDFAGPLSEQISRFKAHSFDDVATLIDLLAEQYGVQLGKKKGGKGNVSLVSFDGCRKVEISIADHIDFGPELKIAKDLIDECIEEWSEGSGDEIRALVNHAFDVEKTGKINREALFSLRRLKIEGTKWKAAMQAITDSMSVIGSKSYIRVYKRPDPEAGWEMVQLNIASV